MQHARMQVVEFILHQGHHQAPLIEGQPFPMRGCPGGPQTQLAAEGLASWIE